MEERVPVHSMPFFQVTGKDEKITRVFVNLSEALKKRGNRIAEGRVRHPSSYWISSEGKKKPVLLN